MTDLRNQTINNIINALDLALIDTIINDCIKTLKNNNTHDFIIVRFLSKMEMSLNEIEVAPNNNCRIENLQEAIRCINKHELNKVKLDTKET